MIDLGSDTRKKPAAVPTAQSSKKKQKRTNSEKRVAKGRLKVARVEENKGRGKSRVGGRLLNRKRTAESMASETTQDNERQLLPQARKKKRRGTEA